MDVEVIQDSVRIIRASGEIDYGNVGSFKSAIDDAVRESPNGFVIDLSGVSYMDSAGVQAILSAYRGVRNADGSLALVVSHPNIIEILNIINADKFPGMYICNNLDSAMKMLSDAA